jgi:hypothetical protein
VCSSRFPGLSVFAGPTSPGAWGRRDGAAFSRWRSERTLCSIGLVCALGWTKLGGMGGGLVCVLLSALPWHKSCLHRHQHFCLLAYVVAAVGTSVESVLGDVSNISYTIYLPITKGGFFVFLVPSPRTSPRTDSTDVPTAAATQPHVTKKHQQQQTKCWCRWRHDFLSLDTPPPL